LKQTQKRINSRKSKAFFYSKSYTAALESEAKLVAFFLFEAKYRSRFTLRLTALTSSELGTNLSKSREICINVDIAISWL